jgi:hypothetical protein
MDSAFVLPSKLRLFLACLVVSTLSACAISPGNTSFSGREQSDVKLPVQKGEEIVPENVKVKPITAELIIEMFNAARPSRAVGSTANAQPAKASQIDPATQALNYKLGPGRHPFHHRLGSPRTNDPGRYLPYRRTSRYRRCRRRHHFLPLCRRNQGGRQNHA